MKVKKNINVKFFKFNLLLIEKYNIKKIAIENNPKITPPLLFATMSMNKIKIINKITNILLILRFL